MHDDILSDLVVNKIHSISTMYTEKNIGARRKNRPLWAIVIKYEGETHYISNGKDHVSNINNITVLPKGSDYDWRCTEAGHFSIIEFECEKSFPEVFTFPIKNGESFLKTVRRMEIGRTLKKNAYLLDELRDLYGLISSLLKSAGQRYIPSAHERKILPAIRYIAENYSKHIRNEELAQVAGLSTVYFRKLFAEVTGMSPINYIQSLKMKKAMEMLQSDYSGITGIAYSLGYNNVYEFSRSFKKYTGKSPSQYAKQYFKR